MKFILSCSLICFCFNTYSQENRAIERAIKAYNETEFVKSISILDSILKINQKNSEAIEYRALCYYELGKFKEAVKEFTLAIRLNPKDTDTYIGRANSYLILNDYHKANKDYDFILNSNPNNLDALLGKANSLLIQNRDAKEILTKILTLYPDNINATSLIARLYYNNNEYEQAIFYSTKFISQNANYSNTLNYKGTSYSFMKSVYLESLSTRGFSYYQIKDLEKAIHDLKLYTQIDTNNSWVYYYLGLSYFDKSFDTSLYYIDVAIKLNPQDLLAHHFRANIYMKMNKYEDAINDCNYAINNGFTSNMIYFDRGVCLFYLKRNKEALIDLDKAVKQYSHRSDVFLKRGEVNYALGNNDSACEDWKKADSIEKGSAKEFLNKCK